MFILGKVKEGVQGDFRDTIEDHVGFKISQEDWETLSVQDLFERFFQPGISLMKFVQTQKGVNFMSGDKQ